MLAELCADLSGSADIPTTGHPQPAARGRHQMFLVSVPVGALGDIFSTLDRGNEQDNESQPERALKTHSFGQSSREWEGAGHWGFRPRKPAGGFLKAACGQVGWERPFGEPTKRFILESGDFRALRSPEVISMVPCHVVDGENWNVEGKRS